MLLILFYFGLFYHVSCSTSIKTNEYDDYLIDEFEACYIHATNKLQRKQCSVKFLPITAYNRHNHDTFSSCNLCLMDHKEHVCNYTSMGTKCEKYQYQMRPAMVKLRENMFPGSDMIKMGSKLKTKHDLNIRLNTKVDKVEKIFKHDSNYFLIPQKCILGSSQWRNGLSRFWHYVSQEARNSTSSDNNENYLLLDWWLRRNTLNKGKNPFSALSFAISMIERERYQILFYGDSMMQQYWEYFVCDLLRSGVEAVTIDYGPARRLPPGRIVEEVLNIKYGKRHHLLTVTFVRQHDFPPTEYVRNIRQNLDFFTKSTAKGALRMNPVILLSSQLHIARYFFFTGKGSPDSKVETDLTVKAEANFRLVAEVIYNATRKNPTMHIIYLESFAQHFPQSLTGNYVFRDLNKHQVVNAVGDDRNVSSRACDPRSTCCEAIFDNNDVLESTDGIVRHLDHVFRLGYNNHNNYIDNNNSNDIDNSHDSATNRTEVVELFKYANVSVLSSGTQSVKMSNGDHVKILTMTDQAEDGFRWRHDKDKEHINTNNNRDIGGIGFVSMKDVSAKYLYYLHPSHQDCTHMIYIPGSLSFFWQKIESVSEEIDEINKMNKRDRNNL